MSAAASLGSSWLEPVSAAKDAGLTGRPAWPALSSTRLSRHGATEGQTAWASREKMPAPAGPMPGNSASSVAI
jgi:hypothetical protein